MQVTDIEAALKAVTGLKIRSLDAKPKVRESG
jgi:hypothetical protein